MKPTTRPRHPSKARALAELAICYLGAVGFIAIAEQTPAASSAVLKNLFYLASAFFMILLPAEFAFRRGFDIDLFGLSRRGALTSIKWAVVAMAVVFPPYVIGFHWYAQIVWHKQFVQIQILPDTAWLLVQHTLAVGLPEEFFYRGYLQRELERLWPTEWVRILGVPIGPAFLLASALFAIGHLALVPAAFRLAVFFPSLLFGWLYKKTNNIVGGMVLHGVSNVLLFTLKSWYS